MSETLHQCFAKAHQVIWFEKHHISAFWLSNMLFSKMIIFMHANTSKERLEETTLLIPPLFHASSGWWSLIPNATCTSVSTEANEHYLLSNLIILSATPLLHLEAPGQDTASAWSLVSAVTPAGPQQEAHEQRSSEMEITHELLMQERRGQPK